MDKTKLTPETLRQEAEVVAVESPHRKAHVLAHADAWKADRARVRKLTTALEVYAAKDEWIGELTVFGERADGGEWEYDYDLPADSIFQCVDNKGWMIAHEALAATPEEKDGN